MLLRLVVLVAFAVSVGGCAAEPTAVPFTRVDLPPGMTPAVLAADGDAVLVGVRKADKPGLVRVAGQVTEIPLTPTTPYGKVAKWTSVATDGERILAVGGERGGAHGNVRWSVWTGTADEVVERKQGFSTFGGYGAGDLIGGVLTADGPVVVGAWESARAALDVAVWTIDANHVAARRSSAGTALESTREEIGFPTAVTGFGTGALVAGWQVQAGSPVPVVWHSTAGAADWTKTVLPDHGKSATADAVACWDSGCAVTGRVDGSAAVWRLADGQWTRLSDMPVIPLGEREPMIAPVVIDDRLVIAVPEAGRTRLLVWTDGTWATHDVTGPERVPTAMIRAGDNVHLITGGDTGHALWRTDIAGL